MITRSAQCLYPPLLSSAVIVHLFIKTADFQNSSPRNVAGLRVLEFRGYHHGRGTIGCLCIESLQSSVTRRTTGSASPPQFPGSKLHGPFHLVRALSPLNYTILRDLITG